MEKKKIEKILYLPDEVVEKYEKLMEGKVDYDANDLKSFETVKTWTVIFGNGYEADLKLCTGCRMGNDPLWAEAVLFHEGSEVCCTELLDSLLDAIELEDEGTEFIVYTKLLSEAPAELIPEIQ